MHVTADDPLGYRPSPALHPGAAHPVKHADSKQQLCKYFFLDFFYFLFLNCKDM
jgi:hypothetical protein